MTKNLYIILKHTSRTLYLSIRMMPRKMGEAFAVAYLLCRAADSVADTELITKELRLEWIRRFPLLVRQGGFAQDELEQLAKTISGVSANRYEETLLLSLKECIGVYESFNASVRQHIDGIVKAVCLGMETDLLVFDGGTKESIKQFNTENELKEYCKYIGGGPGIFWSRISKEVTPVKGGDSMDYAAEKIGEALQITNIVKDVAHDLRIGRCYFPKDDLGAVGLSAYDLLNPKNIKPFKSVLKKWTSWGLQCMGFATDYYFALPRTQFRQRASVIWPIYWSLDTMAKVLESDNLLEPNNKVRIPKSTIYRTMLLTPFMFFSNALFKRGMKKRIEKIKKLVRRY